MGKSNTDKMRDIRDKVWNLTASPLYEYRKKNSYYPVLGEGNHKAAIMFIGEAPGKNEAKTGRPFCGAAGRILTDLIKSIGLQREDVYITNIVKDRPPENRDPKPEEIAVYAPFLDEQINIIQPDVIATLGRFSMAYVLNLFGAKEKNQTISKLHGLAIPAKADFGDIIVVPLLHPAVALYTANKMDVLRRDFQLLKQFT